MKGYPKFNIGDTVEIEVNGKPNIGEIFMIDKNGIWADNSDVYYDIIIHDYIHRQNYTPFFYFRNLQMYMCHWLNLP